MVNLPSLPHPPLLTSRNMRHTVMADVPTVGTGCACVCLLWYIMLCKSVGVVLYAAGHLSTCKTL